MVKATNSSVSFAVPGDWLAIGADVTEEEARNNAYQAGQNDENLAQGFLSMREGMDLVYASPNPNYLGDSVHTLDLLLPHFDMNKGPFADSFKKQLEDSGRTVLSRSTEPSPLGDVYFINVIYEGMYVTIMLIPTKDKRMLTAYSSSLDEGRALQNAKTLISTLTE